MTKVSLQPKTHAIVANGLMHHVLEWSSDLPATAAVWLIHGFMDAAGTWEDVAPLLAKAGARVFAPDMRGFGQGPRLPQGSYYHFADYVADLADLVDALGQELPLVLVGHSMGGAIATLYAGAFPERVALLVSLEGLGPHDTPLENAPSRMRRWIEQVRRVNTSDAPRAMSREEALAKLRQNHPTLPEAALEKRMLHLARSGDEASAASDTRFFWRVDPLHRTVSPTPFLASLFVQYAKSVTCPVVYVSGGKDGYIVPDADMRLAAFRSLEVHDLEGAGHMMHWTRPEQLGNIIGAALKKLG